jgi:hypothetical protein
MNGLLDWILDAPFWAIVLLVAAGAMSIVLVVAVPRRQPSAWWRVRRQLRTTLLITGEAGRRGKAGKKGPAGEPDLLKALVAGREIPCPICRYSLRGNETSRCPECGASLNVSVTECYKRRPWLRGFAGVVISFGAVLVYGLLGVAVAVAMAVDAIDSERSAVFLAAAAVPVIVFVGYGVSFVALAQRVRAIRVSNEPAPWGRMVEHAVLGPAALLTLALAILWLARMWL